MEERRWRTEQSSGCGDCSKEIVYFPNLTILLQMLALPVTTSTKERSSVHLNTSSPTCGPRWTDSLCWTSTDMKQSFNKFSRNKPSLKIYLNIWHADWQWPCTELMQFLSQHVCLFCSILAYVLSFIFSVYVTVVITVFVYLSTCVHIYIVHNINYNFLQYHIFSFIYSIHEIWLCYKFSAMDIHIVFGWTKLYAQ